MDQKVGQRVSQSTTGHTNSNEVRLNIIYLRLNKDFAAVFLFVFFLFVLIFRFFLTFAFITKHNSNNTRLITLLYLQNNTYNTYNVGYSC